MDLEIVRPDADPADALQVLRAAKQGVIRVKGRDTEAQLVCRFTDAWVLLDYWPTRNGPVLCPWFTHRKLRESEFHYFGGCPGCDVEMESDIASAFTREEASSVLEDYIRDGSLPDRVRTPHSPTAQLIIPLMEGIVSGHDANAIDWRPYGTLRRDR